MTQDLHLVLRHKRRKNDTLALSAADCSLLVNHLSGGSLDQSEMDRAIAIMRFLEYAESVLKET